MGKSKERTPPQCEGARQQATDWIVFILRRDSECERCKCELGKGEFICLTGKQVLCLECAGLSHLEFLPSGDVAITRRATKYSELHVVVMKKSAARKRSERQGILAEPEAIRRAEEESAADADERSGRRKKAAKQREKVDKKYVAQFARAIHRQYPGCPEEDGTEIAVHACKKHSGRVGRSAAAKEFDSTAIRLAVIAHIRHKHTKYDRLLERYGNKQLARREVRDQIDAMLDEWEQPVQSMERMSGRNG
ncbi:MAG: DUF2293 domain-containing protein [Pirellulales bacterium]|nr:DUF2293 domain-containing protein [Pirellulales bacterium]